MKKITFLTIHIALGLIFSMAVTSTASAQSGFLDDYSIFDDISEDEQKTLETRYEYMTKSYKTPGMEEAMSKHKGILIDQPEVWLHPDSPYKGLKPEAMKHLADFMRQKLVDELSGDFEISQEAGPGVAVLDWAITDMYIQKKPKKIRNFTPIGFVVNKAALTIMNDIWKKVDMVELSIESALYSDSGELIVAGMAAQGARKDKAAGQKKRNPVSWEKYDRIVTNIAIQMGCALKNSRLQEDQKINCVDRMIDIEDKK